MGSELRRRKGAKTGWDQRGRDGIFYVLRDNAEGQEKSPAVERV